MEHHASAAAYVPSLSLLCSLHAGERRGTSQPALWPHLMQPEPDGRREVDGKSRPGPQGRAGGTAVQAIPPDKTSSVRTASSPWVWSSRMVPVSGMGAPPHPSLHSAPSEPPPLPPPPQELLPVEDFTFVFSALTWNVDLLLVLLSYAPGAAERGAGQGEPKESQDATLNPPLRPDAALRGGDTAGQAFRAREGRAITPPWPEWGSWSERLLSTSFRQASAAATTKKSCMPPPAPGVVYHPFASHAGSGSRCRLSDAGMDRNVRSPIAAHQEGNEEAKGMEETEGKLESYDERAYSSVRSGQNQEGLNFQQTSVLLSALPTTPASSRVNKKRRGARFQRHIFRRRRRRTTHLVHVFESSFLEGPKAHMLYTAPNVEAERFYEDYLDFYSQQRQQQRPELKSELLQEQQLSDCTGTGLRSTNVTCEENYGIPRNLNKSTRAKSPSKPTDMWLYRPWHLFGDSFKLHKNEEDMRVGAYCRHILRSGCEKKPDLSTSTTGKEQSLELRSPALDKISGPDSSDWAMPRPFLIDTAMADDEDEVESASFSDMELDWPGLLRQRRSKKKRSRIGKRLLGSRSRNSSGGTISRPRQKPMSYTTLRHQCTKSNGWRSGEIKDARETYASNGLHQSRLSGPTASTPFLTEAPCAQRSTESFGKISVIHKKVECANAAHHNKDSVHSTESKQTQFPPSLDSTIAGNSSSSASKSSLPFSVRSMLGQEAGGLFLQKFIRAILVVLIAQIRCRDPTQWAHNSGERTPDDGFYRLGDVETAALRYVRRHMSFFKDAITQYVMRSPQEVVRRSLQGVLPFGYAVEQSQSRSPAGGVTGMDVHPSEKSWLGAALTGLPPFAKTKRNAFPSTQSQMSTMSQNVNTEAGPWIRKDRVQEDVLKGQTLTSPDRQIAQLYISGKDAAWQPLLLDYFDITRVLQCYPESSVRKGYGSVSVGPVAPVPHHHIVLGTLKKFIMKSLPPTGLPQSLSATTDAEESNSFLRYLYPYLDSQKGGLLSPLEWVPYVNIPHANLSALQPATYAASSAEAHGCYHWYERQNGGGPTQPWMAIDVAVLPVSRRRIYRCVIPAEDTDRFNLSVFFLDSIFRFINGDGFPCDGALRVSSGRGVAAESSPSRAARDASLLPSSAGLGCSLVHCSAGMHRSCGMVIAYLLWSLRQRRAMAAAYPTPSLPLPQRGKRGERGGSTTSPFARPTPGAEREVGAVESGDRGDVVDACVQHVRQRRNIAEPIGAVTLQLKRFAAELQIL